MNTETIQKTIEQLERVSENLGCIGETEDWTEVAIHALEFQQEYQQKIDHCIEKLKRSDAFYHGTEMGYGISLALKIVLEAFGAESEEKAK